jgi:type II secretory pathway component PulF
MNQTTISELLQPASIPERALLRLLATSHDRQLNIGELVSHLSISTGGKAGKRLRQLAELLSQGVPVVDALRRVPDVLDASTVMALHLAETDGELADMYQQLLASDTSNHAASHSEIQSIHRPGSALFRSLFSIFFAMLIITFLMTFVIPTFEKMFDEFGLALPTLMTSLIVVSDILPSILLLMMIGIIVYLLFNANSMTRSFLNRFSPIVWQKQNVPSRINVLSLLAIACQSRLTLRKGIASLAAAHPVAMTRQRLARTNARIEGGEDPLKALASEQVISIREWSSLSLAKSADTQSWLFRWFATQRWTRSKVWEPLLATSVSTIATLFLGLVTAWCAIAVMMTLMSLVGGLA